MLAKLGEYQVNVRKALRCKGSFSDILEATSQKHGDNVVAKRIWRDKIRKDLSLKVAKQKLHAIYEKVPAHENIIQLYDIENDEDHALYLFMERADEYDLQEFVETVGHKQFVSHGLTFMIELTTAVEWLHRHGVIHKNIKPENVLVKRNAGNGFITKLSDVAVRHFLSSSDVQIPGQSSSSIAKIDNPFMPPEYWANYGDETAYSKDGDTFSTSLLCLAMIQITDDDLLLRPKIESPTSAREINDPIRKVMKDRLVDEKEEVTIAIEREGDHHDKNMMKRVVGAATVYQPQLRISVAQMKENFICIREDPKMPVNLTKAFWNGPAIDVSLTVRVIVPVDGQGPKRYYTVFTGDDFYLGGGHFGEVYKALGSDGKGVAAKKFLRREHLAQEEKEKMETCKHVNIVEVFHFGESRESKWIFMELCQFDLKGYFDKYPERYDDFEHKFDIMTQITCAISYLHDNDMMHRDIKPGNVLVKNDQLANGRVLIKVSDFGLAKLRDPIGILTGANTANIGTPCFMAPEHFNNQAAKVKDNGEHTVREDHCGTRYYGRSADVFSLGLTFASMIRPFADYLMPRIHGRETENIRIGEQMFRYRQENNQNPDDKIKIVVDEVGDIQLMKDIKDIIRKTTRFSQKARISARDLYTEMNAINDQMH